MALDRVADRLDHHRGGYLALHQVILRAPLHGGDRDFLVVHLRQDHDRHVGSERVGTLEGDDSFAVRELEVQQDRVDPPLRETLEPDGELPHALEVDRAGPCLSER